jgi:hypothetical protein
MFSDNSYKTLLVDPLVIAGFITYKKLVLR